MHHFDLVAMMPDKFLGRHTIMGDDGSPYMTRYWIGRLRLHIFYRGDLDPDPHDHPWHFWTFPLTSYVEEVLEPILDPVYPYLMPTGYRRFLRVVPAWRLSFRKATHTHRVLGRYSGYVPMTVLEGKIITLVWRGPEHRKWGFLKNRDGEWCWQPWKRYLAGGKHAPCSTPQEKE